MERFVLGIDIGTTSVKAVLVSAEGRLVDEANASHGLISVSPGWAEERADCWWVNTVTTVRDLISRNTDAMRRVECVGVTGMVPAIVLIDENGNTIQQNGARSVGQIEEITSRVDQNDLYAKTGGFTNQQHVFPRML